jgi:hypothetical protein
MNVRRVGDHPAHRAAGLPLHLGHPVLDERLGGGHHHFLGRDLHGKHLVALRIGRAHGVGHAPHVHLERIDAQVRQARALGKVLGQRFDIERLAVAGARHGHVGQTHQGVLRAFGLRTAGDGALRLLLGDDLVIAEPLHHAPPIQRAGKRPRRTALWGSQGSFHQLPFI